MCRRKCFRNVNISNRLFFFRKMKFCYCNGVCKQIFITHWVVYMRTPSQFSKKKQSFASSILRILAWTKFEFVQVKDHTRFQGQIKIMGILKCVFSFRPSGLILKQTWIKGIQVCLNDGSFPFPRGDKYKIVKIKYCPNLRNHSANIIQPWQNVFLGKGKWSLFIWKPTPYAKGR